MEIRRVSKELWGTFSQYHYLTESIPNNAYLYVGYINYEPVVAVAMSRFPHPVNKNLVKVSRVVTLPHWQGYGLGMRVLEKIIEMEYTHRDVRITTTLPIIHDYLWKNEDKWVLKFQGIRKNSDAGKTASMSSSVREVYMETYQYRNDLCVDDGIKRTRCPKDKRKVYTKEV